MGLLQISKHVLLTFQGIGNKNLFESEKLLKGVEQTLFVL